MVSKQQEGQEKKMRAGVNKSTGNWRFTMKHLIVAVMIAALAVVATDARANNILFSAPLVVGVNPFSATHIEPSTIVSPFTDTFTFTGGTSWLGTGFMATLGLTTTTNLDFLTATLEGSPLILSGPGIFETAFTPAPVGLTSPVVIVVTGTTGATGPGILNSSFYSGTLTVTPVPVPEPVSLLLLGAGLAGIGIWRRKSTKS
jgi:hypothetical protein